jgi:hypothetical protein
MRGSKTSLEQAAVAGEQIGEGIRSIRKWRAAQDGNDKYVYAIAH